ncbi:MAG: sulfotransferase [Rhodobacterales bacterium]|nr:sulfotransferase [Rhodobacterales bacterium]
MKQPSFFIAGAPKCGTTAMDSYLDQHPDIHMGPKELNYFCDDLFEAPYKPRTEENFLSWFAGRTEAVQGEGSVFYMCSRNAAANIRAFNPDAKILIQLRNPLQFLPSHHSQLVFEGYEDLENFADAYDAQEDRRAGRRIPEKCPMNTILDYQAMADFEPQIRRFLDTFPRQQLHFILFDDFKKDLPGEYRKVLEWLGVAPDFTPDFKVVNPNKQVRNRALMSFMRKTPDWVTTASQVIPASWRHGLKEKIKDANTKFTPRDPMPDSLRQRLRADMAEPVARLGALLGRDLGHWLA